MGFQWPGSAASGATRTTPCPALSCHVAIIAAPSCPEPCQSTMTGGSTAPVAAVGASRHQRRVRPAKIRSGRGSGRVTGKPVRDRDCYHTGPGAPVPSGGPAPGLASPTPPTARQTGPGLRCVASQVQFSRAERQKRPAIAPNQTPRHQRITAFWAWRRFSASSKTTEWGPSMTALVTSSLRCAGRQCMNRASALAWAIRASLT